MGCKRKIGGPAGTSRSAADRGGARTDAGGEHSPGGRVDQAQDVVRAAAARDAGGRSRGDADGGTLRCAALEEEVSRLQSSLATESEAQQGLLSCLRGELEVLMTRAEELGQHCQRLEGEERQRARDAELELAIP